MKTIATRGPNGEVVEAPATVREARLAMFGRAALESAGFKPKFMRKALKRIDQAMDAQLPSRKKVVTSAEGTVVTQEKGGAPDHSIRLKASLAVAKLADTLPRGKVDGGKDREPFVIEVMTYTDTDGTKTAVRVTDGQKG